MDTIDQQLVNLLQNNGRETISNLSKLVGLSMPAVSERVKRLESSGVIKNFTAVLNPILIDKQMIAFVHVGFDQQKHIPRFLSYVDTEGDILECHRVTGDYEFILKIQTKDTASLEGILTQIKSRPGVNKTHSMIVLSKILDHASVRIN